MDLESRVRAGAAHLDAEVPGWWARIDITTLQMASCTECILGQLFGDFANAPAEVAYSTTGVGPVDLGFVLPANHDWTGWIQLRHQWISQILRRRRDADNPAADQ